MSVIGILFSLHYFTAIYGSDSHIFLFELLLDCHKNEAAPKLPLPAVLETLLLFIEAVMFGDTSGERQLIVSSHMACSQTHLLIIIIM